MGDQLKFVSEEAIKEIESAVEELTRDGKVYFKTDEVDSDIDDRVIGRILSGIDIVELWGTDCRGSTWRKV